MITFLYKFSDWIGMITNIYTFSGFILGLATYGFLRLRKKVHLKHMLSLGGYGKKCFVSIPRFDGTLSGYRHSRDVAIYENVSLLLAVNLFLAEAGIKVETDVNERDALCSEIEIGGPAANEFTNLHINYGVSQKESKIANKATKA